MAVFLQPMPPLDPLAPSPSPGGRQRRSADGRLMEFRMTRPTRWLTAIAVALASHTQSADGSAAAADRER